MLEYYFPLVLLTFMILYFIFPYFKQFVLATCCHVIKLNAEIIGPSNVSNPVIMSCFRLAPELGFTLKFLGLQVLLPYLNFSFHSSSNKSLRNERIWFVVYVLIFDVVVIFSGEQARACRWTPWQSIYSSIMSLKWGFLPIYPIWLYHYNFSIGCSSS